MRVLVNGTEQEIEAQSTVAELVARFGLEPKHVAVEINYDLVPRRTYGEARLNEGDQVEIVTLVGGG